MAAKRGQLAALLRRLAAEQRAGEPDLAWPNIAFQGGSRTSLRREPGVFDSYLPSDEEEQTPAAAKFYGRSRRARALGRAEDVLTAAEEARRSRHAGRQVSTGWWCFLQVQGAKVSHL